MPANPGGRLCNIRLAADDEAHPARLRRKASRNSSPRFSSSNFIPLGKRRRAIHCNGVDLCIGFHCPVEQFLSGVPAVIVHAVGNHQ